MGIHQVILSCNEDPVYIEFWKPVAWAYKKILPDVEVHLAFLTMRIANDPVVKDFEQWGRVTLFYPFEDVPEFAQAKMIRYFLAAKQPPETVCYIDDIDLIPLSKKFITDKIDNRKEGHLLCVGGEVYNNTGTYPVSQMTAEARVWKQLINPHDKSYRELYNEWKGKPMFDRRENICLQTDWTKDDYFSDERLLRRLMHENPVPKQEMARGYDDYLEATIDRHTWNKDTKAWDFDREKLKRHGYVNAHGVRPFKRHEEHYAPIIQYIKDNY